MYTYRQIKLKFDKIILTETWLGLQDIVFNRFLMPCYSNHFISGPKNQNGRVFIFLNNTIKNCIHFTDLNLTSMTCLKINFLLDVGR